jgi:serine/threonine protein kinase
MSEPSDAARTTRSIAELLDGYLDEVARAGTADLDLWAAQIERGVPRERFRREALAEEFTWRSSRGEAVVLEAFAARLADESDRKVFGELVRANRLAERTLPPQYAPGSVLADRYRIRSILGRGGMSVVFAAWDDCIQREVAIKVFNAQAVAGSADEWEAVAQREGTALARLDHPNVVRVYDIRRDRAHTYLVMDRVAGVDLGRALDDLARAERHDGADPARRPERLGTFIASALPHDPEHAARPTTNRIDARSWPRTVARILAPVVRGIASAHALGQVHRDLKPNNVLLREGADPVVLDFGLCVRVHPGAEDSAVLRGTPEYFAPEQARDLKSGSDVRTDVYQLGLVLFEMLSLERAQARARTEEILRFLARVSLGPQERVDALPKTIPRALRAICAKALDPDVDERYASADALAQDLERFAAGLPNSFARTGAAHASWQRATWLAKKPVFVGAIVGLVALGGAWMRVEAAGKQGQPVFSAFQYSPDTHRFRAISARENSLEMSAESAQEYLGVEVRAPKPAWIYALGVCGGSDGRRGVYPRAPSSPEHVGTQAPAWGVHLESTEPTPLAVYGFDGRDPLEGILVLALEERSSSIEAWLDELQQSVRASQKPVAYETAMATFERLANTNMRGAVDLDPFMANRAVLENLDFEIAVTEGASKDGRLAWFQQILHIRRQSKD